MTVFAYVKDNFVWTAVPSDWLLSPYNRRNRSHGNG